VVEESFNCRMGLPHNHLDPRETGLVELLDVFRLGDKSSVSITCAFDSSGTGPDWSKYILVIQNCQESTDLNTHKVY